MRTIHFMYRNKRLICSAPNKHVSGQVPGRGASHITARIADMRASGMSTRAIRRALGLSEAAAAAAGLLVPGRQAPASAPGTDSPDPRRPAGRGPHIAEVLDAVSRCSGIDGKTLTAPGQRQPVVRARQLVMYLIRELCPRTSLSAIGFVLNRDHTTVHYGCRRAEALLRGDRAFRDAYLRTRRALTQDRIRAVDRIAVGDSNQPRSALGVPKAGSCG